MKQNQTTGEVGFLPAGAVESETDLADRNRLTIRIGDGDFGQVLDGVTIHVFKVNVRNRALRFRDRGEFIRHEILGFT